jgi:hypothetical protein
VNIFTACLPSFSFFALLASSNVSNGHLMGF